MSIPASTIVQVVPGVLSAGGNPLALNGLVLSQNPVLPLGAPISFPTLASVQSYFGQYSAQFNGTVGTSSNVLTVNSITQGTLAVGQEIQAAGIAPGTYISALGSGTGGTGTYALSATIAVAISAEAMYSYSLESTIASAYFNGFNNSTIKPNTLLFSRYAGVAIPAFTRGASMPSLTLAQVQAIPTTSTISVTINGTVSTSGVLSGLTAATSMSNAASIIQTAFSFAGGAAGSVVTWSSSFNAFVITGSGAGTTATISGVTNVVGSAATTLGLTTAAGAILSQGSAAVTPAAFMASLILLTQNWAAFTTAFEPVIADKEAFATWVNGTGGQYVYMPYDSDITIAGSHGSYAGFMAYVLLNSLAGVFPIYIVPALDPGATAAGFALGFVASINWSAVNGRAAISFKSGSGISPSVVDPTTYANALANGYNFYGTWATSNQAYAWMYNGQISGPYAWLDSYVDAIWLNNALQLALVNMFQVFNAIPYNAVGRAIIEAGCMSTIAQAVSNGVINTGVALTSAQIAQVDNAAGLIIDPLLATRGWYLQVNVATPTQIANRQSPTCTLWYMDGGSVNALVLASIDIQ